MSKAASIGQGRIRRPSEHHKLTTKEAKKIEEGWNCAVNQGLLPTLCVTFNFDAAPSLIAPIDRWPPIRDALKSHIARRCRPCPEAAVDPFTWIEIHENPPVGGRHVHVYLYVPEAIFPTDSLANRKAKDFFNRNLKRAGLGWMRRGATACKKTAVDVSTRRPKWEDARDYCMKGGVKSVRVRYNTLRFGTEKMDQGKVIGPRFRLSHSLGKTAQLAFARTRYNNFTFRTAA